MPGLDDQFALHAKNAQKDLKQVRVSKTFETKIKSKQNKIPMSLRIFISELFNTFVGFNISKQFIQASRMRSNFYPCEHVKGDDEGGSLDLLRGPVWYC